MLLKRFNLPDLVLGVLIIIIGAIVFYIALSYPPGRTALMGPGYMPRALGVILVVMGGILLLRSAVADKKPLPQYQLRAVASIMLAIIVFGFLIHRAGFVPAVAAATIISSFANPRARLIPTLILSVVLAVISSAIFIWGLKLNAELVKWPNY